MGLKRMMFMVGVLITTLSFGRNIYVDNAGNDANNGSIGQPYRTINKAALEAVAGDTVVIKSGTYYPTTRINVANSGLPGSPIVFRAEVKDGAIIDGAISSSPTTSDRLGLFMVQGSENNFKSYVIIDGIQVINSRFFGIFARYADNIIVKNCTTIKTGASGICGANASNITILNNVVKEACIAPGGSSVNTSECITVASVDGFEIAYNSVSDRLVDINNGGEGIDAKNECKDGTIHHNTVFNLIRVGIYVDAFQRNINNIDVYANKVYDCLRGGITVASEEGGIANDVRVHDNLIYNIGRVGLRIAGYLNNGPLQNISVYQNTIYNCGSQGVYENCGILLEASNPANFGFVIRNNIVSGCPLQIKSNFSQPFPVTINNNIFFGSIGGFSANTSVTNTMNVNPLHVSLAALDFRLQANSPAIDKAIGSPLSTMDINGVARPQGAQGDLGAFEYVSTLPLHLISFGGNLYKDFVQLKWNTVSEVNVSKFQVEKSSDAISFRHIGTVAANNSLQSNSYTYSDHTLTPGIQYYRLKMLDKDGAFSYSKLLAVQPGLEDINVVSVFPNPVTSMLTVQHAASPQTKQYIKVVAINGVVIAQVVVAINTTQTKIDVSRLSKGSYLVVFEGTYSRSSTTFIK